jgi:hypothetical protein
MKIPSEVLELRVTNGCNMVKIVATFFVMNWPKKKRGKFAWGVKSSAWWRQN